MVWVKVAAAGEIKPDKAKCASAAGKALAVFNVNGKFFVMDNTCTHRGGPLCEGELDGTIVTCPLHGHQFDVVGGKAQGGDPDVRSYPAKVEGGNVMADV